MVMIFLYTVVLFVSLLLLLRYTGFSLLSAFLHRFFGKKIRIQSVGWKAVYGIDVSLPNGLTLHIHSLRVIFFPHQFTKPLLISLSDVRIEGASEVLEEKEYERNGSRETKSSISRILPSILQYVAVLVDGVHVIWLDSGLGCMLHFTLDDIRLEAFRGLRSWQGECTVRFVQGKALERVSPSPPMAEVSLALSISIDTSQQLISISLDDPSISISHRAIELCSSLVSSSLSRRSSHVPSSSFNLSNLDVTLSNFSFRYHAIVDGTSRSLCLSTGKTILSKRDQSIEILIGDLSLNEQSRKGTLKSTCISGAVKLNELHWECRLSTAGVSLILPLVDLLSWKAHIAPFLRRTKLRGSKEKEKSLSVSLMVEVSHLGCSILALDAKEWSLVAKLVTITKLSDPSSLEMAVDELWVNCCGRIPVKGIHQWGEVVYIGTAIVEVEGDEEKKRIVVAVDDCKIEWSEETLTQLDRLIRAIRSSSSKGNHPSTHSSLSIEATLRRASIVASARGSHVLALLSQQMTIRGGSGSDWNVSCKETRIVSGGRDCGGLSLNKALSLKKFNLPKWNGVNTWKQKEDELKQTQWRKYHFEKRAMCLNGEAPSLQITVRKGKEATVQVDGPLFLSWSPLLHTLLLHLIRVTKGVVSSFSSSRPSSDSPLRFAISANESVQFDLELPQFHLMRWCAPVVQLEISCNREVSIISPSLTLDMNSVTILNVTDVCICRRLMDSRMDSLRAAAGNLYTPSNKVWSWTAERLHFFLPFQFNFAAVFDEFVTSIKWVKIMNGKRGGRPLDPPIAADLHLLIQEAILEIEDDPFERRLRNSCELGEDEVYERERRRHFLENEIARLTKSVPFFPQSKVDEMHRLLLEKHSSIYMARHCQLGENKAPLVESTWTKLELRALADESLRRDEDCISFIQQLDPAAPLPPGIEWTTLWGRHTHFSVEDWNVQLRDYRVPYLLATNLHIFGRIFAAERFSQGGRSLRERPVSLPHPWTTLSVNRNISPLKFFYDLQAESDQLTCTYGPCWEPALAMISLQWNNMSTPSRDPSPLLPFWDKMRFLLHGKLLWAGKRVVTNMLASLDPYNTTEMVEWNWSDWGLEWGQGEMRISACLEVFLRTASRYDDSRLLTLPRVNLRIEMGWNCLGQPYDHHAVELCTKDKLPHSATQHDSYRAFRSLSLNVVLNLIVHPDGNRQPKVLLYANCIRCLDVLFKTLSRMNGNTRRGPVFGTPTFNKKQLSKHFRNVHVSVKLPPFDITYYMSHSSPQGLRLSCHQLELVSSLVQSAHNSPSDDKLRRRTSYRWLVEHISATLGETQVVVLGVDPPPSPGSPFSMHRPSRPLVSFSRVVHTSERANWEGTAQRRVTVHELRLWWTSSQRDVCLAMAEGFRRAQLLRSMLSHNLKVVLKTAAEDGRQLDKRKEKGRGSGNERRIEGEEDEEQPDLLEKLIEEADTKKVAHCEHSTELPADSLQGISQAYSDDVTAITWLIELVNSQMMLSGEGGKVVLLGASRTTLTQKLHRSVWRSAQLLRKKSWSALLNGMQYFAPIERGTWEEDEIGWLSREVIEDKGFGGDSSMDKVSTVLAAGEAVGGVVNVEGMKGRQLQRLISRCSCQIYWVSFTEEMDNGDEDKKNDASEEEMADDLATDCITLKHNMLEATTNSQQYSLAVDLVNQLVLFVDPRKKENAEKRSRRLFECKEQGTDDMIAIIENQQRKLREVVCIVRTLERQLYALDNDEGNEGERNGRRSQLLKEMEELKVKQMDTAEHMSITISVLKQRLVQESRSWQLRTEEEVPIVRKFEVCFEDCTWKLTEADGMLAIAQVHITNFLYTRTMRVDNSGEHFFELGALRVRNQLLDAVYPDTVDRDSRYPSSEVAVRVICRDLAPVGGICVKEHFEVNIAPHVVQLTQQFHQSIMSFVFPDRNKNAKEVNLDTDEGEKPQRRLSLSRRITGGLSMVRAPSGRNPTVTNSAPDDIDRMRQRADSNTFFLYIKIPEVPFLVSYKGNDKKMGNATNISLIFPLCEYHEKNWAWLDLANAVTQRCKRVLVQQFMKQKLLRNKNRGETPQQPSDEDKKRIAIGTTSTLVEKQKK